MADKGRTFLDALNIFGEKSQAGDSLKSLQGSLRSMLGKGIQTFISKGEVTGDDMQDIFKSTPFNIGTGLGKGYGINLGINTPSSGGVRDDYRLTLSKKFEEGGEVSGIDWDFISTLEGGSQTEGYIPKKDGKVIGKSGLTIGTGWDVGQMSLKELKSSGLPASVINKVKDFVGLTGKEAQAKLKELGAPVLKEDETSIVDAFTHGRALSQISKNYEKASGKSFEDLSSAQQTVLASVGFQYGSNLKEATSGFWKQVISGDWEGAHKNLMNFGDEYGTRREKEAGLLEKESIAAKLAKQADEEGT